MSLQSPSPAPLCSGRLHARALWKHCLDAAQLTHLSCVILCFGFSCRVVQPSPPSDFRAFHSPSKSPMPVSSAFCLPPPCHPAPPQSTFCLSSLACFSNLQNVTGSLHLASHCPGSPTSSHQYVVCFYVGQHFIVWMCGISFIRSLVAGLVPPFGWWE